MKFPRAEKNAHDQLLAGSCGACVSTLGAISLPLVSEFLPLFGWALHKLWGRAKAFLESGIYDCETTRVSEGLRRG